MKKKNSFFSPAVIGAIIVILFIWGLVLFSGGKTDSEVRPIIEKISKGECVEIGLEASGIKINIEDDLINWEEMNIDGVFNYRGLVDEERYIITINGKIPDENGEIEGELAYISDDYLGYNWFIYTPTNKITTICIE